MTSEYPETLDDRGPKLAARSSGETKGGAQLRQWRASALVSAVVLTVAGCASAGPPVIRTGDIHWIKKIVDPPASRDSTAHETRFVQVIRREGFGVRDSVAARQQMPLAWTDSLLLASQWRARLRVSPGGDRPWEWAVVLPELQTARGQPVLGPPAGPNGGLYALWNGQDGTRLDLYRGALVLKDWGARTDGAICVHLAGACAITSGASYAARVDERGAATLYVESGRVTITRARDGPLNPGCTQLGVQPLSVSCPEHADAEADALVATAGTAWSWGFDTPYAPVDLPPSIKEDLRDAIQYNGEDLWRERRFPWYPLLLIPAAIVVCVTTDIWFCGSDDPVSGRVTFDPSPSRAFGSGRSTKGPP